MNAASITAQQNVTRVRSENVTGNHLHFTTQTYAQLHATASTHDGTGETIYLARSDVIESMVTIRMPFCEYKKVKVAHMRLPSVGFQS